jgi:hypothetical protein
MTSKYHEFVMALPAALFIRAVGGRAAERSQPAEFFGEGLAYVGIIAGREGRTLVVAERKKDFNEMHS